MVDMYVRLPRREGVLLKSTQSTLSFKMSTLLEVATVKLKQATESFQRAEEDFRDWRLINPTDFSSVYSALY
jgi:hypothetical protein